MERLSEAAIEIVNTLHRERLDYESEYSPLIDALNRLAAYENTGLDPEEIAELVDHSEITPQQEYFISEKADSLISRLKELIAKIDERNHVTELLQAEAEPKHAHVIIDEDGNIECSNCGSSNCFDNYCGHCGAKLENS